MFLTSLLSLIVQPPSLPAKRRIRAPAILGKGSLAGDDGQRRLSLLADILFGAHGIKPRGIQLDQKLLNSQLAAHDGCPLPGVGVMLPGTGRAVLVGL